jgi:WD40 repeat protein
VSSAAFNSDGRRIVTASRDKTARLWDTDAHGSIAVLGHPERVLSAAFSPDGKRVVIPTRLLVSRLARLRHDSPTRTLAKAGSGPLEILARQIGLALQPLQTKLTAANVIPFFAELGLGFPSELTAAPGR